MKKVYFHIDVNSAYLSWESARRLRENENEQDLRMIPSIISGNQDRRSGVVLAKSTSAKKYGIVTGEPVYSAVQKCPELYIAAADFDLYIEQSEKLMEFLGNYSPDVYQYSIDEAFIDMTGTEKLFGRPEECADNMRKKCKEELGFTINIGISDRMVLAKMAGDFSKPDKTHTLFSYEIKEKLWPLPIEELFFVGSKTSKKLRRYGLETIGDVAQQDLEFMKRNFKKHGEVIFNHANGIDGYDFLRNKSKNKSIGNSTTTAIDITDMDSARHLLLSLTETVGARMRKADLKACVVSIDILDTEFRRKQMQKKLEKPTSSVNEIYKVACRLLNSTWDMSPLRHMGVSCGISEEQESIQLNFFDEQDVKDEKLYKAIDIIRGKHGNDSIKRASFLKGDTEHMEGGTSKNKKDGLVYM